MKTLSKARWLVQRTMAASALLPAALLAGCAEAEDAPNEAPAQATDYVSAAKTETSSGDIHECTSRWSPGAGPSQTKVGYCIGWYQFAGKKSLDAATRKKPDSDRAKLQILAETHLGKEAELVFEPANNEAGCDLFTAAAHPIECAVKDARTVRSIKVEGKLVFGSEDEAPQGDDGAGKAKAPAK